jgi:hypothetical protein
VWSIDCFLTTFPFPYLSLRVEGTYRRKRVGCARLSQPRGPHSPTAENGLGACVTEVGARVLVSINLGGSLGNGDDDLAVASVFDNLTPPLSALTRVAVETCCRQLLLWTQLQAVPSC